MQYHPDKNQADDAQEVFMIIKKAYETLINPVTRAQHDFVMDFMNVQKLSTDLSNYEQALAEAIAAQESSQTNIQHQQTDKKYYRTNQNYTPNFEPELTYKDRPILSYFGTFSAFAGLGVFIFMLFAFVFTEPITSKFTGYKSRMGRLSTEDKKFFAILSDEQTAVLSILEANHVPVYIKRYQSKYANFSTDAEIELLNTSILTIGYFALLFSFVCFALSCTILYLKKTNFYLFIKFVTLNVIVIFFWALMIW